MGRCTTGVLNVENDALVVVAPPINVGNVNFVEEVLWVIVGYAKMVWPMIHDHGKKEPLEAVAAPLVTIEASWSLIVSSA